MNIRSRSVVSLAAAGLFSCAACTAEKPAIKPPEVAVSPSPRPSVASSPAPSLARSAVNEGVFTANDHLASVYFDLNQSRFSEGALEVLKQNAEWLKSQPPFLIRVVGYADARGSVRKNERLAAHRADSVRKAYVSMGIQKNRILADARIMPIEECPGLTEECLSQSRRSDTLIEEKSLAVR